MGQVRNDTGEIRVLPTMDYAGFEPGQVIEVADEDVYHWVAGGFTPLTKYPVPHRLYPNHQHDPLAYALPEPDPDDPSAIAVGKAPEPGPTATASVAPPPAAVAAPAAADTKEQ